MKTNYKKNPRTLLGYLLAFAMVFFSTSSVIAEDLDITVGGGLYLSEVSWEIVDASGVSLTGLQVVGAPAWSGTIAAGCYSLEMYDSYGDGWNGSTYSIVDQTTGQIYATGGLTAGAYGSDQVCWGVTGGCTDPAATNYNATAAFDDGSCTYSSCTDVTLNMVDSWGDGWNGNTFTLTNSAGVVSFSATLATGALGTATACLPDDCYSVACGGGSFANEVSWTLTDTSGAVLASGGSPASGSICFPAIFGCTDSTALNFDPLANTDDGTCTYPSCVVLAPTHEEFSLGALPIGFCTPNQWAISAVSGNWAFLGTPGYEAGSNGRTAGTYAWIDFSGTNTNIIMEVEDVDVSGLTAPTLVFDYYSDLGTYVCAANNIMHVEAFDGTNWVSIDTLNINTPGWNTYIYSTAGFDVAGVISIRFRGESSGLSCDFYNDLLVDDVRLMEAPILGCMDAFASNYDPTATVDDGSCLYPGCTDPFATNYCSSCNVNDPAACIYPQANALDFCDDLESASLSTNGWTTITGSEAGQFIGLTVANAIADTVSIESTGADVTTGWGAYGTEADAFANVSHVNSATILFDMSAQSGIVNLGLDYQTQSGFTNTAVGLVGTAYSTMRVKVNGNVVSDINGISWHGSDGSLTFDLSSNAGDSAVYVTIETACKYNSSYSSGIYGDFVWVDNICAYEVTPCTNYGIAAGYAFDASCNGGSDGQASATAFGDAAFTFSNSYDWTDAAGVSVGTTSAVSGLSAGTYTCTSTDATNGCSASTSVTIGEPTAIVASGFVVDATSPINTDGSVSLSASGGSPCFTGANDTLDTWDGGTEYVWSGVATGMTNYFDITATNGSGITGFDVKGVYAVPGNIEVWTRTGTSNGYTTDATGWTLNTSIPNSATVNGETVYVPLMMAIGMESGDVTGIAIYTPGDHYMTLGGFDAYTAILASDANVSVSTGLMCANGPAFGGASTYGGVASSSNFDGMVYYTAPAYTYAWSNGATTANVSNLGIGPIAVTVTDCNGCTGTWSGFVAANIVNGCTDPLASNFDPSANTDDGSCTYTGCLDSLATNFDPMANLSDSSCTYSCQYNGYDDAVTITAFTDLYATEASWQLLDANGDTVASAAAGSMTTSALYTTEACVNNGCYFLYFQDSYGDGWTDFNGTVGYIQTTDAAGNILSSDTVLATGGSATVSVGGSICIAGCTDSTAVNYDPTATSDDGSCVICNDNFMTLNMYDSWGDGWNGNTFTMTNSSGAMFVNSTLAAGSFGSENLCLATDCWTISCDGGSFQTEVSWELVDVNGTIIMTGGAPYTGTICLPAVAGCMDSLACNYDPLANTDNGSCDFSCYGCTDPLALNYDATMTVDDGSCYYCSLTASTSVVDESGVGANDGAVDLTVTGTYCVTNTDLPVSLLGGNGQSGNAFNVINTSGADLYIDGFKQGPGSGNTSVIGASMEVFCAYGDYVSGTPTWTSVATAIVDLTASAATGYCQIPGGVTIPAGGTYGFWVGVTTGTVQYTNGTGTPGVTPWASDANVTVTEGHGGTYPTGLNFSPRNWNGTVVYGDPNATVYTYAWSNGDTTEDLSNVTSGTYSVTATDCMGCMVSASATVIVNMVPGCTDPASFNYNPIANFDDGSCVAVVDGCTDSTAANYDATANTDDGSCHYCFGANSVTIECDGGSFQSEVSWDLLDASGAIILSGGAPFLLDTCLDDGCYSIDMYDSWGDGWNGNVFSITDNTTGSSVSAGLAAGLSTGNAALNSAAFGCFVYGCTDPLALNYDALANSDDGTCTYPACVTALPFAEDFETGMADVTLIADAGNFGSASSIDSLNNSTWSWHGQGGDFSTWLTPYSTGPDAFATNPTHIATMAMCVDLTAYAGQPVTVSFDLRQEFSFNGTYSYFRLADDMGAVLVDGNGNDYFQPATACLDAWANVSYDLSAYAGGVVNLMFQSCNKYNDDYYQCGDNAYVDNINISVQATPVNGCTDPTAVNYDPAANTDNGSCCFGNWSSLEMFDSYGDGWNGNFFVMTDVMTGVDAFNSTCVGAATTENGCVPDGCYDITVGGGSWQSEVSWDLYANLGDTVALLSGGAPYTGQIAVGATGSCAIGCTDSLAVNYDASALVDDGSCMYPCTDNSVYVAVVTDYYGTECSWDITDASGAVVASGGPYSIGYNTISDSTCVVDGCYTLNMYDGFGDGWATGVLGSVTLTDGMGGTYAAGQLLTGTSASFDFTVGTTLGCTDTAASNYDACANTDDGSCVYPCADNDVTITVGGGSWDSEIGWSLVDGSGAVVASGGAPYSGTACLADDCYTFNMTDAYGDGWNGGTYTITDNATGTNVGTGGLLSGSTGSDDISIGAACPVYGCTDSTASNYDANANMDDGSCTYPCLLDEVTLTLTDSYGDGWNGGTLTIDGVSYTQVGSYSWPYTAGASESFVICVDLSTCITATYSAGSYSYENSWSISDASGAVLASGGPVSGQIGNCISLVDGCTDSTALNYDPLANNDDGSCIYCVYGCTDSTAVNYAALATCDDGTCIATVYGCTDATALNYYAGATVDDGSCVYVAGCTDATACNYDPLADFDDGSCEWTSCNPTTCGGVTGVNLTDVIHDRLVFNWDDMNSATCVVDQIRIRYSDDGGATYSNKTMGAPLGNSAPALNTSKLVLNLTPSTVYVYDFKIWYQDGTTVNWHANGTFTTADVCANATNMTATPTSTTATEFCWDAPASSWEFVRLQYRENVAGSSFSNIGGFGVIAPALCKTKNGLVAGTDYRVMWRTWCNATGGPYRSPVWDGPVIWTQPTVIRLAGGTTINNLAVYPNPSRDIFNVSFTSEDAQDLEVRVINVVGEVVYTESLQQFVGEYTKQVDLATYTKGVYFLEITTNNGVVNKKLILQ